MLSQTPLYKARALRRECVECESDSEFYCALWWLVDFLSLNCKEKEKRR